MTAASWIVTLWGFCMFMHAYEYLDSSLFLQDIFIAKQM